MGGRGGRPAKTDQTTVKCHRLSQVQPTIVRIAVYNRLPITVGAPAVCRFAAQQFSRTPAR